jgi:hypothetical protein
MLEWKYSWTELHIIIFCHRQLYRNNCAIKYILVLAPSTQTRLENAPFSLEELLLSLSRLMKILLQITLLEGDDEVAVISWD